MMISPESYYELNLKGKNEKQIMTVIRGLKQEIGRLKNIIEHPDYGIESLVHPSELVRIECSREYLNIAKKALTEAGGVYTSSKSELKADEFDNNVSEISKVVFSIGGFFDGYNTYIVDVSGNELKASMKQWETETSLKLFDEDGELLNKQEFLNKIRLLHMGEWRKRYSTDRFGYVICDGTQWDVLIEYRNGHKPMKFYGDNSYPYNFSSFQELFGIEQMLEDNDDDSDV